MENKTETKMLAPYDSPMCTLSVVNTTHLPIMVRFQVGRMLLKQNIEAKGSKSSDNIEHAYHSGPLNAKHTINHTYTFSPNDILQAHCSINGECITEHPLQIVQIASYPSVASLYCFATDILVQKAIIQGKYCYALKVTVDADIIEEHVSFPKANL